MDVLVLFHVYFKCSFSFLKGRLDGLTGSMVSHRSIAPGFKTQPGYVRRLFLVSLHLITFGGRLLHLAYLVHKSVHKTAESSPFVLTY